MKIKDNFFIGLLIGALSFGITYLLMRLIPWSEKTPNAPFLLSFIPGLVLTRMMLVKWNRDKMGRGVMLISCIGLILVFFLI